MTRKAGGGGILPHIVPRRAGTDRERYPAEQTADIRGRVARSGGRGTREQADPVARRMSGLWMCARTDEAVA